MYRLNFACFLAFGSSYASCREDTKKILSRGLMDEASTKRPIRGILSMGKFGDVFNGKIPDPTREPLANPKIYDGTVILATWSILEGNKGTYDFQALDQSIRKVEDYNTMFPNNTIAAKIRVLAGKNSPGWALQLGGGPVDVVDHRGNKHQVPLFWNDSYRLSWKKLQKALANRYDRHPLVREVAISSCATLTAEPFIQPLNPMSRANLRKKGFNDQTFRRALEGALDDYSAWKNTYLHFPFNAFSYTDGGKRRDNTDFTIELMRKFRARYGKRAILANHGLQENLKPVIQPVYDAMLELGGLISFQTISPSALTTGAIEVGVRYGATQLELWVSKQGGGQANFTMNDLRQWKKLLLG